MTEMTREQQLENRLEASSTIDFSHEDWPMVDFTRQDLHLADFHEANLERANLSFTSLYNSNFDYANLRGANFDGSRTCDTTFFNADLEGARGFWASHTIISEILRQHAPNPQFELMAYGIAGMVDYCWDGDYADNISIVEVLPYDFRVWAAWVLAAYDVHDEAPAVIGQIIRQSLEAEERE